MHYVTYIAQHSYYNGMSQMQTVSHKGVVHR